MKKLLLYLMVIINLALITSCSIGGNRVGMLNHSNDEEKSKNRLEQMLDFIVSKDDDGLKGVFSIQALEEDDDFDSEIEYLFEFFQGEVVAWELLTGPQVSEMIDHGSKTKELKTWYEVETDSNTYIVFILEFTEDTENPENLGVYALRIVKEVDKDTQMTYWQEMAIPGIYMPEEQ